MSNGTVVSKDIAVSKPEVSSWYRDINAQQWKSFIAALLGWTLDAMHLLLFTFAVSSIATVFKLKPTEIGAIFSVTLFSSAFGGE